MEFQRKFCAPSKISADARGTTFCAYHKEYDVHIQLWWLGAIIRRVFHSVNSRDWAHGGSNPRLGDQRTNALTKKGVLVIRGCLGCLL